MIIEGLRRSSVEQRVRDDLALKVWGTHQGMVRDRLAQLGLISGSELSQTPADRFRHNGSEAYYPLDYYFGDHRILLSVLFAGAVTTRHYHPEPIRENYIPLLGEIFINSKPINPRGVIVLPYTPHQASTRDKFALTLIVMQNARLIPESQQHVRAR